MINFKQSIATVISSLEPSEPEPARQARQATGTQEWYRQLPPPKKQGINMNDLARSVPKPKPPRRPSWWNR